MKMIIVLIMLTIVSANINLLGPLPLKAEFGTIGNNSTIIDIVYSNFGRIPYGQSISGRVYYSEKNFLGCNKTDLMPPSNKTFDQDLNKIFLVERGDCHFVSKVRNI
jgi:hypothetical protein